MLLRKWRLQRGWSQDQLAELSGLSVRTIQRIEHGQAPSVESAKALAAVLEVDFHHLRSEPHIMNTSTRTSATISPDEGEALRYGKRVMGFYSGLGTWLVLALVFFPVFGFAEPALYWAFGGSAIGLIMQGLYAFEVLRLPMVNLERRLVEKRLGRKL